MKKTLLLFLFSLLTFAECITSQEGFDNETRALYIMDISKYIEWPTDIMLPAEGIFHRCPESPGRSLLGPRKYRKNTGNLSRENRSAFTFSGILIRLNGPMYFTLTKTRSIKCLTLLKRIEGKHTLLISEGYEFRESMLNFIVVDGKPQFEVNEKLMNEEGLKVDEMFLALAVKTREDWEALFNVTDEKLQEEKEITRQQKLLIDQQEKQIADQRRLICSAGSPARQP